MDRVTTGAFLAVVAAVAVLAAWAIGSALHRQHRERREVRGPDGRAWSTRIHWAHPEVRLGVAEAVFNWSPLSSLRAERPSQPVGEPRRARKRDRVFDLADLFTGVDEGALVIGGVLAILVLCLAGIVVVLLAVELALFLLLFGVLGAGRALLGHPWSVEIVDPDGGVGIRQVVGLGEARRTQRAIDDRIAAGAFVMETVADV